MRRMIASLGSLVFLANVALAQSIVVPSAQASTTGDADNRFPFGPDSGETVFRYQQAYSASEMAPLAGQNITSIAFRMDSFEANEPSHTYNGFLLIVSTNSNLVDNLSTAFDTNHGTDQATVYSGTYVSPPLQGGTLLNPYDFVIDFQTPFPYLGGDFLIDVRYASTTGTNFYLDAHWDGGTPLDAVSRVADTSSFSLFADTLGLITEITAAGTPSVGTNYCGPAVANSSGGPAEMSGTGSASVGSNDLTLHASGMPQNQFGYFLNSTMQAFVFPVPNSQGALCLGGAIGRYNTSVFNTGSTGTGSLLINVDQTPTPTGNVPILAGQTWNFTCWFRDDNPGSTSNFTDGLSVDFVN